MKYSLIFLMILAGNAIANQSAYGNQTDTNSTINNNNSANSLTTQPVTIDNQWRNSTNGKNHSQPTGDAFVKLSDRSCNKINPVEIIENPVSFFRECPPPENAANSPYTEPIEYFKLPKLDGGIKVPVRKF
jgi:hypothetical protein